MHFRRAAERLRLAPPSVSEAIAGLERSLGSQLVERTSRRVQLTPFGAEFAAAIRQPIEALQEAGRPAAFGGPSRTRGRPHPGAWPAAAAGTRRRMARHRG
ncbi:MULTISPECIES: LysR family transcriptional regulator [unclassified Streptomyces]|uniref:LysR family transcriptional regulator n=1 Tax=unclassified Streptomyces TaxID=2593676 RepID=UPI0036E4D21F